MSLIRQVLTVDHWLPVRRGALISHGILMAILTHVPVPQTSLEINHLDKLIHLLAYFPLGLLLPTCRVRGCQGGWVCLLVIGLYGILDELLQIPVGRTASVLDWAADLAGATMGYLVTQRLGGIQPPEDSPGGSA